MYKGPPRAFIGVKEYVDWEVILAELNYVIVYVLSYYVIWEQPFFNEILKQKS